MTKYPTENCNIDSCGEVAGRRLAEQRLSERERRYHDILHNLADAIYLVEVTEDGCFRYLETNRAFDAMMGVAADSLLGKTVGDLLRASGAETSAENAIAKFRRCLELGSSISGEITLDTPSGRRILHSTLTPLFDDTGRIDRILGISRDVTERKRAEIALTASQQMLTEAQAIAKLGSWDWDVVGNRVEWSDMAYDIYTPDERPLAPGYEEFKQSVHPDDLERVDAAVRSAFEHDTPFDIEHRVVSQSKGVRTVHAQARVFRDHDGNPIRMVGTVQDITERKAAEAALRASEERMRLFFERQLVGMAITSPEKGWLQANDKICEMFGYTREELTQLTWAELTYPDDLPADLAQFERMLGGEIDSYAMEKRYLHKDGRILFIALSIGCVRREDRSVNYVLALLEDITEQKSAFEIALRYQEIFENVTDGVFVLDVERDEENIPHFRFVEMNPAMVRMGKLYQGNVIGRHVEECVPKDAALKMNANYRRCIKAGKPINYEMELKYPGGMMMFDSVLIPMLDEKGSVYRIICVTRDISERKRMEAEARNHLRFFESMDSVNRVIQGSNDLETVLNQVLETVLAIFDCDRAFLTYPCDPEVDSWSVPFEKTTPEFPGALALGLGLPMDEDVATTFRLLLEADRPLTYGPGNQHLLPKEVSEQFGFKSYMAVAVYPKGDKPWQFGIHQCSRTKVWTADEQKLFQEIGRRLADALTGLLAYRDIQEREQKFRTLAENLPDNIVRYNREGVTVYVNPVLERTLGDTAASMIGTIPREYHSDGSFEDFAQLLDAVLANGMAGEIEKQLPGPNGRASIHHIRIVPEHGENGELIGALAIGRDITERKQAEEALLASEQKFRSLAENMPDTLIRYDREGRRTYVNPTLIRNYAVRTEQMIGLMQQESNPFTMPETYRLALEHTLATGKRSELELRIPTSSGDMRDNLVFIVAERTADGQISGAITIGHDITERKQAEALLVQREQEFRTLAENLPDYIARYDLKARKTYANPKLEQLLGGNIKAWIGKTPKEANPGGEYDEYQAKIEDTIRTGQCDDLEHLSPDGNGGWIYFHIRFVPERGPDDEIVGALALGRDVTQKRQLELELVRNERKFRTLVKNSPGFIARFDTELRRTYVNQVYQETTNIAEDEVLGKTPLEYWRLTVPDAEEFCTLLRRVMASRQQERIEAHAVTATGALRYFTMHMVPEVDDDGEIDGVLTTGIEITDMKNAERLKVEAREDERKVLARELHDDLGQRLTALRLDIALLDLRFGNVNPELLAKIKDMDVAVGETIKIIRSLLTMLRPAILDLGLVPAMEWLAGEFRKRTDVECSLQLPKQTPVLNEGQSIAIFRIVQESLTNIVKYAQASKVSITLTQADGGYLLEIQDDGQGFDLGESKKKESFGLKGIAERVQMLGGKLTIASTPGRGVKLTVQLPK
jgi:PAS domain S-box-containing protein